MTFKKTEKEIIKTIVKYGGDVKSLAEKMQRLTSELSSLFAESHRLEDEIKKQLGSIGFEI